MAEWEIAIDEDFVRAGFDPASLESDELRVRKSERLSVVGGALVVALVYVGKKVADATVGEAVKAAVGKLATFAQSREKRLRVEIETTGFDPRVKLAAGKVEAMAPEEFRTALDALPRLRVATDAAVSKLAPDDAISEVWFAWDGEQWVLSYFMTEGGDVIEGSVQKSS